jgi:hypothetical protein
MFESQSENSDSHDFAEITEELKSADEYLVISSNDDGEDMAEDCTKSSGCIYTKGSLMSLGVILAGFFDLNPKLYTMMMALKQAEMQYHKLSEEVGAKEAGAVIRMLMELVVERLDEDEGEEEQCLHTIDDLLAELGLDPE